MLIDDLYHFLQTCYYFHIIDINNVVVKINDKKAYFLNPFSVFNSNGIMLLILSGDSTKQNKQNDSKK